MKAYGIFTGLVLGGIYGIISGTKLTTSMFLNLGTDFEMGRMVSEELEVHRKD